MDFDFTPAQHAFRADVRAWIEAHVPAALVGTGFTGSRPDAASIGLHRAWQLALYKAGYVGMDWPPEFGGRGASLVEQIVFYEELARAHAPGPVNRGGLSMLGPTLMAHGTAEQQRRFLPGILTAEEIWCQGFSEPNAGSDLANVATRAERRGDRLVVNGQKVWTSMAHVADWGFFLVRTSPESTRHAGLTFLLVDMGSRGITVRPLRQITGEAEFNEVFLEDVEVPAEQVVGAVGEGWTVAMTTLAYERDVLTFVRHIGLRDALDRLRALARCTARDGRPAAADPVLRQRLAALVIAERALQLNGYRSLTRILRGGRPGPEGSIAKLFWSRVDQDVAQLATEILGLASQLAPGAPGAAERGDWALYALIACASGIRAGTSEILLNILGERVLGLPRG